MENLLISKSFHVKVRALLSNALPVKKQESSWAIIRLFRRYILKEGLETFRIDLGSARIACIPLTGKDNTCPLDEVELSWYEKKCFVPINVMDGRGFTRVLMNKRSFLKNYQMTPQQKAIVERIFAQDKWNVDNIKVIHHVFHKASGGALFSISENQRFSEQTVMKARRELARVGAPKTETNQNREDTDIIVRAVMRHPSADSRNLLERLHEGIKSKLESQSDEGLLWLLGGSSKNARGGFQNVKMLQKFLNTKPSEIPSSRLISGLETLFTAIAYRALLGEWCEKPFVPVTESQKEMFELCCGAKPHFVDPLKKSYPDKETCISSNSNELRKGPSFRGTERAELSDGSDLEPDGSCTHTVPERLPKHKFYHHKPFYSHLSFRAATPTKTWVYAAYLGNVPVRASVSGSSLLSFAVAEWLLGGTPGSMTKNELEILAGVLIIPTYVRGDYHSIAESAVGLSHFLAKRPGGDPRKSILSPKQALTNGLSLMEAVIDTPYKANVKVLSSVLLAGTQPVFYTPSLIHERESDVFQYWDS